MNKQKGSLIVTKSFRYRMPMYITKLKCYNCWTAVHSINHSTGFTERGRGLQKSFRKTGSSLVLQRCCKWVLTSGTFKIIEQLLLIVKITILLLQLSNFPFSVIIQVINKIRRLQSWSRICSVVSMITGQIRHHKVLLPINHNHYNFQENKSIPFFVKEL